MNDQIARQLELAEQQIEEDYANGHMTTEEYTAAILDLQREWKAAAEEAAQDEYDSWF